MMRIKTQSSVSKDGDHQRPLVSVAIQPKGTSGYLVAGIGLGMVFGFILGSVVALSVGDKSLLLAQHLWDRLFGVDTDGERVHFELLLQ